MGNNFGNRGCTGELGFDPVELWVMGPPCGLKVGGAVTSCMVMIARHVRGCPSIMSAAMSLLRARDEENQFLLVKRGGPIGQVLVHRWLPECHQQ